jgi:hypothetical protein
MNYPPSPAQATPTGGEAADLRPGPAAGPRPRCRRRLPGGARGPTADQVTWERTPRHSSGTLSGPSSGRGRRTAANTRTAAPPGRLAAHGGWRSAHDGRTGGAGDPKGLHAWSGSQRNSISDDGGPRHQPATARHLSGAGTVGGSWGNTSAVSDRRRRARDDGTRRSRPRLACWPTRETHRRVPPGWATASRPGGIWRTTTPARLATTTTPQGRREHGGAAGVRGS